MKRSMAMFLTLVAFGGWYVGVYRPASAKHDEVRKMQSDVLAETSGLETELARLTELEKNEPALRVSEARLASALPGAPDMPEWFVEISQLSARSGVRIDAFAPAAPAAAVPVAPAVAGTPVAGQSPPVPTAPQGVSPQQIVTTFQVSGTYDAVRSFIELLGAGTRAVRVEGVTIASGGADSVTSANETKATIRATAFIAAG